MRFKENLEFGRVAEGLIAKWLISRGSMVMPAYEIEKACGKGPQLFTECGDFVAPDMIVFSSNGICWIEAKHKTVFSWDRKTRMWITGIDLRHYADYIRVMQKTKLPVWLLFYHGCSRPDPKDLRFDGCPKECPTGLYGGELIFLMGYEHHRCLPKDTTRKGMVGHGKSGMVYWAHKDLKYIASKIAIEAICCQNANMEFA